LRSCQVFRPQRLQKIRSPVDAGSGTTTSWRT
jgi:hypothetical protein